MLPLVYLAAVAPQCQGSVLGIPTWYKYLDVEYVNGSCNVTTDIGLDNGSAWLIAAAVIEMLLRVAVYVAVAYALYGGFKIIMSSGNPDAVAEGRKSIINAITGMVIAVMAASVVGYLATTLGGTITADNDISGLNVIFSVVYRVAAGLTVIFVALAGLRFITANGDPGKIAQARNSIVYAIVGLLVTLSVVAIISFVGGSL